MKPGVVVEIAQQREVDRNALAVARAPRRASSSVSSRSSAAWLSAVVQTLRAASIASRPPRRSANSTSIGLVERAQPDDVALLHQLLRGRDVAAGEADAGQDAVDDARIVDVVGRVAHTDLIARFDRHEQRFRIRIDARRADQFDAGLREFAHPAFLRLFVVAKRRRHVRQTQRQRRFAHPGRDEPRDRRRHFRPQREHRRAPVVELERQLGQFVAEALLDDVEPLDRRRLHFFIRPAPEHRAQDLFDVAFAGQFVRQPVANALRKFHGCG